MRLDRLTRRLWRHVHPDLFVRWPSAQSVNQRSMQDLNALLEASGQRPLEPQQLRFFVRGGAADECWRQWAMRNVVPIPYWRRQRDQIVRIAQSK